MPDKTFAALRAHVVDRFSNPLLLTFLLVFVTHEWKFVYAVLRGSGNSQVQVAIDHAAKQISPNGVLLDALIALVIFLGWPSLNRWIRNFQVARDVQTNNVLLETAEGRRRYSAEAWRNSGEHKLALEQVIGLSVFATELLVELHGVNDSTLYEVAEEDKVKVDEGYFALLRGPQGGNTRQLLPFDSTIKDIEPVYIIKVIGPGPNRLVFCAKNGAVVKGPPHAVGTEPLFADLKGAPLAEPPEDFTEDTAQYVHLEPNPAGKGFVVRANKGVGSILAPNAVYQRDIVRRAREKLGPKLSQRKPPRSRDPEK